MQQLHIYIAHFDFTTAHIVINCTLKYALIYTCHFYEIHISLRIERIIRPTCIFHAFAARRLSRVEPMYAVVHACRPYGARVRGQCERAYIMNNACAAASNALSNLRPTVPMEHRAYVNTTCMRVAFSCKTRACMDRRSFAKTVVRIRAALYLWIYIAPLPMHQSIGRGCDVWITAYVYCIKTMHTTFA